MQFITYSKNNVLTEAACAIKEIGYVIMDEFQKKWQIYIILFACAPQVQQ